MNIFTKTAAVAMTAVTLISSAAFASPVKKNTPCDHLDRVVYGHECGRVRDVAYSNWIKTDSLKFPECGVPIYTIDKYVRTRSVVCASCRCVFSTSLEYKDVGHWLS